jgi:cysteine desulfurase/selenocysteine lyase
MDSIRLQFPILDREINKRKLVYLDNAATVQKPLVVLKSIQDYYRLHNANVHRGVHTLSQEASALYEEARKKVQHFINAESDQEIIFTKGTTDGINTVAFCLGENYFSAGDEIILSTHEHHSNIVPWQMLAQRKGIQIKVIPMDDHLNLDMNAFEKLITSSTKLIAITHVSNTLGIQNPIEEIISMAHAKSIPVMIDAAQSAPHMKVDVQDLDADFLVFSGHKMYAPTGIGVLYMKRKWIDTLLPYQGGGGIIKTVSFENTEYVDGALKFEAGTPNIEGAIALGAAIDFMQSIGMENIHQHEKNLHDYVLDKLLQSPQISVYGNSDKKAGVISFNVEGVHPFDVGTLLDKMGVCVRTGHHCTQPLMAKLGVQGTVRVSFAVYNTKEEADIFIYSLQKAIEMLC